MVKTVLIKSVQGPPFIFAPLLTLIKFSSSFQNNFETNTTSLESPNIEPPKKGNKKLGMAPF